MAMHRKMGSRVLKLATILALLLACLPAWAEYWEAPEALSSDGRFPSLFTTKAGPLLIWQEAQSSGETGSAVLRFAVFSSGEWKRGSISNSAYSYTATGAPPILYSAAQAKDGTVAVAIAATSTRIELWLCRDGASFSFAGKLETEIASVAPRIYPSVSGGWILFATQGKSSTAAGDGSTAGTAQSAQPSSVSIYVARSADGSSWSAFQSLIAEGEGLPMNFAPFAAALGSKDIVVFQTFILGEGDQSSRYALMAKTSSDGGASWSKARDLSDFDADAKSYDNQGAQLSRSGSRLYIAWERRKAKSTQTQVWAARIDDSGAIDPKSASSAQGSSGAFMLSQLYDSGGVPKLLEREDKLKANRVLSAALKADTWSSEDTELVDRSDPSGSGLVTFARATELKGRTFIAWQLDSGEKSRIFAMTPVTNAQAPGLSPQNFTQGKRSRAEEAQVRVVLPQDPAGIKDYAYIWKKTSNTTTVSNTAPGVAELWKSGQKKDSGQLDLSLPATQDGEWTLWVSVEDNAGNLSPAASLGFYRKRVPPPAPIVLSPEQDDSGFLASNSFTVRWIPPEADDIAGYTWDLVYAGGLEGAGKTSSGESLPGLSAYESELVRATGLKLPPPSIRGTATSYSVDNVDNGYYLFSVSAIDTTGNISGAATVLLRTDKFKPYTFVTLAEGSRDDLGRAVLIIHGRGFLADGRIERVVLSRNGREPYDFDKSLASGDFRIDSDRELSGLTIEDAQAGSYRIGLYHSTRGWYWTSPIIAIDSSGTIKYGVNADYKPRLALFSGALPSFTIYDAIVLLSLLFAALGLFLASRQAVAVVREGELVRREAIALVTGGPMPQIQAQKAARELKRRGAGLRAKFTLTIAFLVILVVLLLAGGLGYNMIRRTGEDLAKGLDQRSRVLLESAAQGGRFFLGKEDAITQLSFLPSQTKAMEGATYITISGESSDPKVATGDIVYATNDEKIAEKVEASSLGQGSGLVLGQSVFDAKGDKDALAPLVAAKANELRDKAASAIADELQLKVKLAQGKASLKPGAAGNQRRGEINAELDQADVRIREKLRVLSDGEVGTLPKFDPTALGSMKPSYLYYKPILEYRPSDSLIYRGMVRLEVSTRQISVEVRQATLDLVRLTLIIAALALGLGIVGAFILSAAIVKPIRTLVAQIERIRDTEDKESLEGSKIVVSSRDELFTLAETVNQMTEGLVSAAKASKELIIGKGIQKMFIPLDPASGTKKKLSTGSHDEKDFEVFGYYEGADAVSGDYWDFRSINSRYHYFIKCDVSGHGVPAALIMVQVATMVINYFNDWKKAMPKAIDLTDLAYKINDFLEERQFLGKFAAFTLGVWDSVAGIAYLCDAGDKIMHVWDDRRKKLVVEELPDSPAAGPLASILIQMKQPFSQITRKLEPNDILFLYTDGIEESKRYFRDADFKIVPCREAEKDQAHENHKGGEDNEEFGYERLTSILEALAARGKYRLTRQHDPASLVLSFDFSACDGSLEEKIIAPVAIEKVYRFYRDSSTTEKDAILVDQKVDAFLEKHFDQYRLYCSDKKPNEDSENPGYMIYHGLKEDPQWDDLTFLAIRKK
jgi:serine phosphatase RsbU (regulator of sigma subunit)